MKNSKVYKEERICTVTLNGIMTLCLEDENGRIVIAEYKEDTEESMRIRKIVEKLWEINRIFNYIKYMDENEDSEIIITN